MKVIRIAGSGISALCCARLLARRGFPTELASRGNASLARPVVSIDFTTAGLLREIFDDPDLLRHAHRLKGRRVLWGRGSSGQEFLEPRLVFAVADLIQEAQTRFSALHPAGAESLSPQWVIHAGTAAWPGPRMQFGRRVLLSATVTLTDAAEPGWMRVESVADGWLALTPHGNDRAELQAVAACPEGRPSERLSQLLKVSKDISRFVRYAGEPCREYPIGPSLAMPLHLGDRIAVGSSALTLDPICGNGVKSAVHSALLLAAVLASIARGDTRSGMLDHYRARVARTFCAHLEHCVDFYREARFGGLWQVELQSAERGLRMLPALFAGKPEYQFNGTDLIREN